MFDEKEKRFVVKESQSLGFGAINIIVDVQTGVNYIVVLESGPCSITPLLDHEGKVVIDTTV